MSSNQQPPGIMTAPAFRYAVLIVLCIVLVLGAGACYRTRIYQNRIRTALALLPPEQRLPAQQQWLRVPDPYAGVVPPRLVDVYLGAEEKGDYAEEKASEHWADIVPLATTRVDDTPGMAQVAVLVRMPAVHAETPPDDDDVYAPPPDLHIGVARAPVVGLGGVAGEGIWFRRPWLDSPSPDLKRAHLYVRIRTHIHCFAPPDFILPRIS
ncbi:hypothetical protein C8J57DRAFT_1493896 [Mycena rebaudengoi]|nr:hypothetical protein C8J57DRAFT_1493896 [Mycena rebaudengoi]